MISAFANCTFVQNDDLVGIANGRQTMRDDQDGSIGFEPSQRRLDERLGVFVDTGGCFIQKNIGALRRTALAMLSRWRSPALRRTPRSPICVS